MSASFMLPELALHCTTFVAKADLSPWACPRFPPKATYQRKERRYWGYAPDSIKSSAGRNAAATALISLQARLRAQFALTRPEDVDPHTVPCTNKLIMDKLAPRTP